MIFTSKTLLFLHQVWFQGFFQALYHNTVVVFQIEFVKGHRAFLMRKALKKNSQSAVSSPAGPGQSPGGDEKDEAPGSSACLSF